jgi:hypothetical protein
MGNENRSPGLFLDNTVDVLHEYMFRVCIKRRSLAHVRKLHHINIALDLPLRQREAMVDLSESALISPAAAFHHLKNEH